MKKLSVLSLVLFLTIGLSQISLAQETIKANEVQELDKIPQFKGGMDGLITYLSTNLKYPEAAKEKGIEGTVAVKFVVELDGSVSNVEILRGIGAGCDQEALRVIKESKDWTPGEKDGKKVRTEMRLPINFKLS
ncbi:energy transducer TonB [Algoriphagus zhangzhouensis]|uniref:TonB family C-terminal domain-containing protein n=1 Tax=Algoriphagus zhangzhouensis TaxID=1073327 RepID=A0A1M7Z460_9BACT|nr:energy transducer TonB [Algoriphagus zhangzhouensis]TDY48590.1 protein TonB [Algoriphagus zhangzhouensis]SHO59655.1 TonB family C-terminal domain-containing protein [Algoriphagus zhangzhouensis]